MAVQSDTSIKALCKHFSFFFCFDFFNNQVAVTVANSIAFVYLRVSFPFIILTFYISDYSSKKVNLEAFTGLLKLQLFKADSLMANR